MSRYRARRRACRAPEDWNNRGNRAGNGVSIRQADRGAQAGWHHSSSRRVSSPLIPAPAQAKFQLVPCGDERLKSAARHLTQLQQFLVRKRAEQIHDIRMDTLSRCRKGHGEIIHDCIKRRLAGASLQYLDRDRVGLEHSFRREQDPATLRFVVRQPYTPRQPRQTLPESCRAGGSIICPCTRALPKTAFRPRSKSKRCFSGPCANPPQQKRPAEHVWAPHRRGTARPAWSTARRI